MSKSTHELKTLPMLLCLILFLAGIPANQPLSAFREVPVTSRIETNERLSPTALVSRDIFTHVGETTAFWGEGFSIDAEIVKYEWDFDGDGRYDWQSTRTGRTSHVYGQPGQYNALFRVWDSRGRFRVEPVRVDVKPEMRQQDVPSPEGTMLPGEPLLRESGVTGRDGVATDMR